jgi:hypothetical protein
LLDLALAQLEVVDGYTYTLRKQERVGNELVAPQVLFNKIRHEPFSVYLRFSEPEDKQGTQAIYVEGRNNNQLWGRSATGLKSLLGWQSLEPQSALAMAGNRYPITNSGLKNTLSRLKRTAERADWMSGCQFEFSADEIDGRPVDCVLLTNPVPRGEFVLARMRMCFDRQTHLLTQLERHNWSAAQPGKTELVEQYTYSDVRLGVELSDGDFDHENRAYNP